MKAYTYFFPDDDGTIPSFDIADCENDAAARRRCPAMLRQRQGRTLVEVFQDDRYVGRYVGQPRAAVGEERRVSPLTLAPTAATVTNASAPPPDIEARRPGR